MIPVAYAPSSVVLDTADNAADRRQRQGHRRALLVRDRLRRHRLQHPPGQWHRQHRPGAEQRDAGGDDEAGLSEQPLGPDAKYRRPPAVAAVRTKPVAIPAKIGDPSLIKHVFLIIRENRTYDQILGDVAAGNGDASLAVFGGKDTPNVHDAGQALPAASTISTTRAASRPTVTSGSSKPWRPTPTTSSRRTGCAAIRAATRGDALAYQKKGFLFPEAVAAGLSVKIYGEYVENETFRPPNGSTSEPSWTQFYADSQNFEAGQGADAVLPEHRPGTSSVPVVSNHLIKNFPQFDLDIPDQFRVDLWVQDFNNDLAAGTVPALSILWIMDDHTGGPPTADAEQADNDLAVGRIIDYISHSNVWDSSAIFIEEDDAQNGVDHVDGHRSPGYVVSPYAVQNGPTDHTYYTQVNMTRTIEQILGLPPMNQFDLVASPMRTAFVTGHAARGRTSRRGRTCRTRSRWTRALRAAASQPKRAAPAVKALKALGSRRRRRSSPAN